MTDEDRAAQGQAGDARKGLFRDRRHEWVSWAATAATLAGYFILMLFVPLAPALLARPLFNDGFGTYGIVAGIGMLVFLIAVSALYTVWNNKLDRQP